MVSTPIGNMEDITLRALNVLKKSDIILCEDTRRSGKLLSYFQIKSKLMSYHKFNEKKICSTIIETIKKDKVVSLISDAGTPTISDPGLILVNKCIDENLSVHPIPGPSAVTSAVSVSGFSDQYLFYGFLTKKENELDKVLNNLCNLDYSIVFFIPASKINFYISKFKNYFFDRKIVIAKEMTKRLAEGTMIDQNGDGKVDLADVGVISDSVKDEFSARLDYVIESSTEADTSLIADVMEASDTSFVESIMETIVNDNFR